MQPAACVEWIRQSSLVDLSSESKHLQFLSLVMQATYINAVEIQFCIFPSLAIGSFLSTLSILIHATLQRYKTKKNE